ncbi:MAG TPA: hypothetical protein VF092_08710 [Longimicrobium sp.]
MKQPNRLELAVYLVLFVVTAGNLGFQYLKGEQGELEAKPASRLAIGSALPVLNLRPLSHPGGAAPPTATALLPTGCRLLVVFHPDCPHCHTAARREAAATNHQDRIPVVWISAFDDDKARDFEADVVTGMPVRYDPDAPRRLKTTAVPVYILVGGDGRVKFWGAFSGAEDQNELRRRC